MTLAEDINTAMAKDPEGFRGIDQRDIVLYIANGVKDPAHIREYKAAGIGPQLAGDMELERD